MIISLITVGALRKQCGALFSAPPQSAVPTRTPQWAKRNKASHNGKPWKRYIRNNYLFENCRSVKETVLRTVFSSAAGSCAAEDPKFSKRKIKLQDHKMQSWSK